MSVVITKYPKRTRSDGNTSKWVALHNPIIYDLQRQDYAVASVITKVILFPTRKIITVTLVNPIASPDTMTVGDYIYLKCGVFDVTGYVYDITSSTVFSLYVSAHPGTINTGGFINLITARNNYHAQVDILAVNNSGSNYEVIGSAIVTPTPTGLMKVDVHEWVKELAGYSNNYDYATLNVKDTNLSNTFNIRFIETWENADSNNIQQSTINESMRHFFVNAAKQVADILGQNMGVYCPMPSPTATKAKWLSGFERPTIFRGYPFDMAFIYSDNITPFEVFRITEQFDLNDVSLEDDETGLSFDGVYFVNRLKMPVLNAAAKTIQLYLKIYLGDANKVFQVCYANDYAIDYDECATAPTVPDPPIEIIE